MNDININTNDELKGLIERIDSNPDDFDNIKIFLKRDDRTDWFENTEYLMVSPTTMGKVGLIDLEVEDNFIILHILDCSSQLTGNVRIDINDTRPQCYFLRWSDVKQMVLDESISGHKDDDLLEFDFENTDNQ